MINTFLMALGGIVALAGLAGLVLIICGFLIDAVKGLVDYIYERVLYNARYRVGGELLKDRYWFSEDPKVMDALEIIGRKMCENGCWDISKSRDEWREKHAKKE